MVCLPLNNAGVTKVVAKLIFFTDPYQVPEALLQVLCDSLQSGAGGGVP